MWGTTSPVRGALIPRPATTIQPRYLTMVHAWPTTIVACVEETIALALGAPIPQPATTMFHTIDGFSILDSEDLTIIILTDNYPGETT